MRRRAHRFQLFDPRSRGRDLLFVFDAPSSQDAALVAQRAGLDALAAVLHTNRIDVTMPGGQNGSTVLTTTQHSRTVRDMQEQVIDARVWLGFHSP